MKTLLTSILTLTSFFAFAQLSFNDVAPLSEHLLEVNEQWSFAEGIEDMNQDVWFSSEEERIATHLTLVIEKIEGENAAKAEPDGKVIELMAQLATYAEGHVFPINNKVAQRQPVFIDDYGTACAVGHLMRENGYAGLAYSVQENMNLAYVKEIPAELLTDWSNKSGLSFGDMALIQPGYLPATTWTDYGSNIEGEINDMIVYQDELYIGGQFLLDGEPRCLAKVVGNQVVPTLIDPVGVINDLEIYEGKIWAAGNFNDLQNLLSWDLSVVSYSTVGSSKYAMGYKLKADTDVMYMSADASGIIGQSNVYIIQDPGWLEIGQFDYPVYAMDIYNDQLHVGGAFSHEWTSNVELGAVASWDLNNWYPVGDGVPNIVYDFMVDGDQIMACGELRNKLGIVNFGTAELIDATWVQPWWAGTYVNTIEETTVFYGIDKFDDQMFIWGDFEANGWMTTGQDVGTFDILVEDELWPTIAPILNDMEGSVNAMIQWNGVYWIAGDFIGFEGVPSNLATTDLTTEISRVDAVTFQMYPNPATSELTITSSSVISQISLFDMSGRLVLDRLNIGKKKATVRVDQLPAGLYTSRVIHENGGFESATFVVK